MGRKKTKYPETTAFSRRIRQLQEAHGYTNEQVMEGIVDENQEPLIENNQTYDSYKSGKRKHPRRFIELILAFSRFYGVSSDYLLELDDFEKPQIKSVHDATGLSELAINNLFSFYKEYPSLNKMIDSLLSFSNENSIAFLLNLYNQILYDYKDKINNNSSSIYDIDKMQERILRAQQTYYYISTIVQQNMSDYLDKDLAQMEDEMIFYNLS